MLWQPRTLVLLGYLVYGVSIAVNWGLDARAWDDQRWLVLAAVGLVASAVAFGLAWWICIPLLGGRGGLEDRVRRALQLFAAAAGLLFLGDFAFWFKVDLEHPDGLAGQGFGMLIAAFGFLWASRRRQPTESTLIGADQEVGAR